MFEEPIVGIADAGNVMFHKLKDEQVIGEHFVLPEKWLPEARSVVSFFFPYTEKIRSGNRENMSYPSKGWLNGRIEGQYFLSDFSSHLVRFLNESGYKSVSPSISEHFFMNASVESHGVKKLYTSNWSERHVAYVCGLGTFSLSKGLITEKGVAGRFASIVTELRLPYEDISYQRVDENCILCGKCINNCPVNAISFEHGKNHRICSDFLDRIASENSPWYGCGKCQVDVPCEYRNPGKPRIKPRVN